MMIPAIIVHGGAGLWPKEGRALARAGLKAAAQCGYEALRNGGSALDAVERAVNALENDPQFNAGTGAAMNSKGEVQLDASLMDGLTLRAGAVASVRRLANPVSFARRLLDEGRHVLMVGAGAEDHARNLGLSLCDPASLITDTQRERFIDKHGTVGCAAADARGALAAGTSTGGRFGALPGRVGDSALIGCGTYADQDSAVSCTGIGEAIIRVTLASLVGSRIKAGMSAGLAAQSAVAELAMKTESEAGLIVLTAKGEIAHARNTEAMPVFWIRCGEEGHAE